MSRAPRSTTIVSRLLHWYRTNARDLPWRRTRDPYAIWISEIMLQQTQVKTVIPFFERWMNQLPSVQSLATARIDRILKLWEGLGYYSRARNAQKAAQQILSRHQGRFPSAFEDILALAGIGRYTAGAISSIAFDQPAPILDGNVIRVLARVYNIAGNPKDTATNQRLWTLAAELVIAADRARINGERACADLNQALMELGALICTPAAPSCDRCPLQKHCAAFRLRIVDQLPHRPARPESIKRHFRATLFQNNKRFLDRQRAGTTINDGLWEFPNEEVPASDRSRKVRGDLFCTVKHTITRNRITLDVFRHSAGTIDSIPDGKWCTLKQLERLAFSSAHKQIVEKLKSSLNS